MYFPFFNGRPVTGINYTRATQRLCAMPPRPITTADLLNKPPRYRSVEFAPVRLRVDIHRYIRLVGVNGQGLFRRVIANVNICAAARSIEDDPVVILRAAMRSPACLKE